MIRDIVIGALLLGLGTLVFVGLELIDDVARGRRRP